ncbi:MAG: GntR family transcriptional regulator, partial [Varibaculum cambriense]|nr:GntR family transcriptional regulator [Varibaculum cambriense]
WSQLRDEFSRRITTGSWPPGSKIPSVRDLAQMVGANPNTVQRALSELEREGLAVSERTAGRFVTQDQDKIWLTRQKIFLEHANQFAATMKKAGATLPQTLDLVEKQWKKGKSHD